MIETEPAGSKKWRRKVRRKETVRNEHRFGLGSKLLLSNALSMLNKNLTGFVQSHFSVQSICTVRKGSASRVKIVCLVYFFTVFIHLGYT